MARKTLENHVIQIIRLYEQLRKKKATPNEVASTLGLYVKRWRRWAAAGLRGYENIVLLAPITKASHKVLSTEQTCQRARLHGAV